MKRFAAGLDLGQITDHSAIAVNERAVDYKDHVVGFTGFVPNRAATLVQYRTRHLERFRRDTHKHTTREGFYTGLAQRVDRLLKLPLLWQETDLIVDATAVGMAVLEILKHEGLEPIPVMIVSGNKPWHLDEEEGIYYVTKRDLVMAVALVMESRRLTIRKELALSPTLDKELRAFIVKKTPAGNQRFEHREGEHDDIVLAEALALWWQTEVDEEGEVSDDYSEPYDPLAYGQRSIIG